MLFDVRKRSAPGGAYEIFCPMGHGRGEKVRPAGKGLADKQAVILDALAFIHPHAGRESKAGFGEALIRPFTAGVVELVPGPFRTGGMEGVFPDGAGFDIAQPLRAGIETRLCREKASHSAGAVVEEQGVAEHHEAAAFGVNGASGFGKRPYFGKMRRAGNGVRKKFGVAAAKVETV